VGLAVGVTLVAAAVMVLADREQLAAAWAGFELASLAVALLVVLGNYGLRFIRWELYLREVGVQVPRVSSALIFFSGFLMSISPGKLGEVLKSALLLQHHGVAVERTAPIVLAERLLDLVALVILVAVASGAFPGAWLIAAGGAGIVTAIFVVCLWRGLAEAGIRAVERWPLGARLAPKLRAAHASLIKLTSPKPLAWGTALGFAGWTLECLATFLIINGFDGVEVHWASATFSYAGGTLAGALSMLPGGLGAAEAGMAGLLMAAEASVDSSVAIQAALIVRFATLWFGVSLGLVAWLALRLVGKGDTG
jgi:uncharacterized protein (TIRG00374 family)